MRLRLGDLKKSSLLRERTKLIPSDPKFTELINEAQRNLVESGNWWGTYQRMRICTYEGCITWPRRVARVAAMSICCDVVPIRNAWYEFQEDIAPPCTECCDCRESECLDRGQEATFSDVSGTKKLRAYYANQCDIGKEIIIQGRDQNGATVRSQMDGLRIEGETMLLANPYVESVNEFTAITGVQKAETVGSVRLYEVDSNGSERQIAEYEPSELNPYYRKSFVTHMPNVCCTPDKGDGCSTALGCGPIMACLVKLEPLPVTVDTDFLVLQNPEALAFEMGSILASLRENENLSIALHTKALKRLQDELTSKTGRQSFAINVQAYGSAKFERVIGGFR